MNAKYKEASPEIGPLSCNVLMPTLWKRCVGGLGWGFCSDLLSNNLPGKADQVTVALIKKGDRTIVLSPCVKTNKPSWFFDISFDGVGYSSSAVSI